MTEWRRTEAHYITSHFELFDGKSYKESWAEFWLKLTEVEKQIIKSIENFDSVVFEEITGINLQEGK
jgi:hypothetical protein